MERTFTIEIHSPKTCSNDDLKTFFQILRDGGQVNPNGLLDRIKTARLLAFSKCEGEIVAIAAVKNPIETYKRKVFRNAGTLNMASDYLREIGWAVTLKEFEGKGMCKQLLTELVKREKLRCLYATTQNGAIRHILNGLNFVKIGASYLNDKKELLDLLAYDPKGII